METITNSIVEVVITLLTVIIGAVVSYFAPKLKHWFDKKAEDNDLGVLSSIVDKGVEIVEKEFEGEHGEEKFEQASSYVSDMLERYGIDISDDLIRSSVQEGWRKVDEKQVRDGKKQWKHGQEDDEEQDSDDE